MAKCSKLLSSNCNNFSPNEPIWMRLSRTVELRDTKKTCFFSFAYFLFKSAFFSENCDIFKLCAQKVLMPAKIWQNEKSEK